MLAQSRRSFIAGIAEITAGATLAAPSTRNAFAQETPSSTPSGTSGGWTFVDDRAVDVSTVPGFTDVAPSLCILGVDVPMSASIERFGELAAALGADTEAETIAASAKPRLTEIALSGALENDWIGNPSVASDLVFLAELGLNLIGPETPDEYASGLFQQISWEKIGKYQADLSLLDNRPSVLPADEIKTMPVVQLVPAIQANQIAGWPVEYVTSYDGLTPTITALAEAVSAAEIVTG